MSRIFFRRLLCPLIAAGLACAQGNGSTPSEAGDAPSGPSSAPVSSSGAIFYIRTDGGNAEQCNGLADAPYPGSGSNQACAWDHPFRAFPPGGAPRIAGGDTVLIAGGSYPMGFGAPGAEVCEEGGSFDCLMSPIPGGPDPARPTRILGAGWDAGCGDPPELWGTGRPWYIVNLTDSSNVEISCFEITDHSPCVENHSGGLACERETPPYGDWASYGLFAEDSSNVVLRDLNIHGLASGGVHAGRLSDWTVENVRIAGNGSVGWDGDLWDEGGDSNSGTMTFRRWVVEWNGCGETYPAGEPAGCWAQEAGGDGDGVGVGETGGDWVIEDSSFLHNTSDGLDLLYHTLGGSVVLNRVHAEGNAGNQIKVSGQMRLTDSVLVGNCAFFEGQPFAYLVDHCRALGNTLFVAFTGGEQSYIANSTFYGQGDGLISGGPREGFQCNGAETLIARNNVFLGDADFFDPSDLAFLFYQENCPGLKLNSDYNIVHNAKNIECNSAGDFVVSGARDICADPNLAGPLSGAEYGMSPNPDSPAVDAGDQGACASTDITGAPRPADGNKDGNPVCDIGAFELP